jgi:hypothetical protein
MTNLTRYESNDGVELVINTQTNEAFATVMGYSRMSGISKQAVSKRLSKNAVNQNGMKKAEILTPGGVQGVNLIPADIVFDWLFDDNPQLARAMGVAGANIYMQRMAGYKAEIKPEFDPEYLHYKCQKNAEKTLLLTQTQNAIFAERLKAEKLKQLLKEMKDSEAFEPIDTAITKGEVNQLLMDFHKHCQKSCEKKNRAFVYSSDLAGCSLLKRKDALAMFERGKNASSQLNKPEILQIFRMLEELNLGIFDAKATTFQPSEKA